VRIAKGEVLSDSWNRKIYSVDASNYKANPSAIVCPLNDQDLELVCQHVYSKGISVTARGSGTGLVGESLTEGTNYRYHEAHEKHN